MIPLLWLLLAIPIGRKEGKTKCVTISGIVIFIGLLLLYIDAIGNAYYRRILISVP